MIEIVYWYENIRTSPPPKKSKQTEIALAFLCILLKSILRSGNIYQILQTVKITQSCVIKKSPQSRCNQPCYNCVRTRDLFHFICQKCSSYKTIKLHIYIWSHVNNVKFIINVSVIAHSVFLMEFSIVNEIFVTVKDI